MDSCIYDGCWYGYEFGRARIHYEEGYSVGAYWHKATFSIALFHVKKETNWAGCNAK